MEEEKKFISYFPSSGSSWNTKSNLAIVAYVTETSVFFHSQQKSIILISTKVGIKSVFEEIHTLVFKFLDGMLSIFAHKGLIQR